MDGTDLLRAELVRAARSLGAPDDVEPVIERPRDPAFGDWATNLAMVLAKPLGQEAARSRDRRSSSASTSRARASARRRSPGPGFINFRVARGRLRRGAARADRGRRAVRPLERRRSSCPVNVEFVSANPTGPLHVGHGRQAALGDAISSLLDGDRLARDARVLLQRRRRADRESRAERAGARARSSAARASRFPRAATTASTFARSRSATSTSTRPTPNADDLDAVRRFAVRELRKEQDLDLQAFGVKFDVYFLESSLYTDGRVDDTVDALVAAGHTYEKDGALWLRTTDFGDDKDRVMRRSAEKGGDAHVLPARRRVPRHEVGARLHARDQRAGRRPSQHGDARARRAAGARHGHSAGLSGVRAAPDGDGDARRRGGEDLQARRQLRHRARSHRRGRPRRGALLLPHAEGRFAARVRRRPRALAVGRESGLLHPDGARAHVRHLPRRRDRRRRRSPAIDVDLSVL